MLAELIAAFTMVVWIVFGLSTKSMVLLADRIQMDAQNGCQLELQGQFKQSFIPFGLQ